MKKLVIVTDAWHPQVNGVVTALQAVKNKLQNELQITVIEPGQFKTMPMPMYSEIRLSLFPGRKINKLLRELRPDFIHIATEGPLGISARRYCIKHSLAFTSSYHTNFHMYIDARIHIFKRMAHYLIRRFHTSAAKTLVATQSLQKMLEDEDFVHMALWPLGVDTNRFIRVESQDELHLPKPVFLYVGRLAVEKNVEEFLKLQLPGSKLVVGDGPDREHLEKKWAGSATFVGYKEDDELVEWYSKGDVFVFPSYTDTFGLVIVEALACGLPVAAFNVLGPRDIITQGVDGFVGDDLGASARACLTLKKEDCREKALRYSWDISARAFRDALVAVDRTSRSI